MQSTIDHQYLTFGMDNELYAVPVGKVREVLEYSKPVKLPKTADYFKGIINIRDTAIPVIDLRLRLGLPESPLTADSAIIVMDIQALESEVLTIGALTDTVYEVVELDSAVLEAAPRFGTRIEAGFVRHIGKKDGNFIIILDVESVFSDSDALRLDLPG